MYLVCVCVCVGEWTRDQVIPPASKPISSKQQPKNNNSRFQCDSRTLMFNFVRHSCYGY